MTDKADRSVDELVARLMDKLKEHLKNRTVPRLGFLETIVEHDDGEVPLSFFENIPPEDHDFFRKVLLKHDYTVEGYTPPVDIEQELALLEVEKDEEDDDWSDDEEE